MLSMKNSSRFVLKNNIYTINLSYCTKKSFSILVSQTFVSSLVFRKPFDVGISKLE